MNGRWAYQKQTGFTIVELLIVIVVIGILAAITIVAYNGVQQRAHNTARLVEFTNYYHLFQEYKAVNGEYPDEPDGGSRLPWKSLNESSWMSSVGPLGAACAVWRVELETA